LEQSAKLDPELGRRHAVTDFAERSPAATRKVTSRRTDDGLPVHRFRSLLNDLATVCLNKVSLPSNQNYLFLLKNVLGVGNGATDDRG
jgi:hypothetical protein